MTSPDATGETPPPEAQKRKRRRRRSSAAAPAGPPSGSGSGSKRGPAATFVEWWGRLNRPLVALAALAGSIATILGLVFLLWPDAQPKPTPDDASVTFERVAVEPLTRRQSLDRLGLPTTGFTQEQLAEPGGFVSFDIQVTGYGGSRLPVRWLVLNRAGDTVGSQDRRIELPVDRDNQTIAHRFWAGARPEGGPFRVVIEIFPPGTRPADPGEAPLRSAETDPFTVP